MTTPPVVRRWLGSAAGGSCAPPSPPPPSSAPPVRSPPRRSPRSTPAPRATAGTGSHATRSASSCSPCATSWPSTSRAPSPPWPRSATPGSSTPGSSAAPWRSSRRRWTPPARVHLRPRPDPPALRPGRLGRLAGRRPTPGVALHRPSVLRDQLRHRRGGPDHGTLAGVRARHEPGRPHGQGRRPEARLPQPQLGVLPPHRRPLPHRLSTSSPTPPTPTWSIWSWTCSGPPGGRATRSTSSRRTGAGSCSTTSRT